MSNSREEFGDAYAEQQVHRSQHPLRRAVKTLYLRNVLSYVRGPSIDFGCGAGQLLERLPAGSVGLELNPALIAHLKRKGLNVLHYDGVRDSFRLTPVAAGTYSTVIMAHVLEHFADAAQVLRILLATCRRLGVTRFILVVPGWKGYLSDPTHKTFVDRSYLEREKLHHCDGYRLSTIHYFPIDVEAIGKYFVFHEMIAVFDLAA
jgi:SAM-dependent methyltransferase